MDNVMTLQYMKPWRLRARVFGRRCINGVIFGQILRRSTIICFDINIANVTLTHYSSRALDGVAKTERD